MFLEPQRVIDHFKISEGMKVADFGSGCGHFAVPIARKVGPYGRVYAIDVMGDALALLQGESLGEGLTQMHFILGDLEKEKGSLLSDNSMDRVLLINTLFSIENKSAVLKEAMRVLHPGGNLILIDWKNSFNHIGPHPDHVIKLDEALDLVLGSGFSIRKEFDAGDMHYGIVFKLPTNV